MSIRALRYGYRPVLLGLTLIVLSAVPTWGQAPAAGASGTVDILGLHLRKDEGRLKLHFLFSDSPQFQVVENIAKRVVVIKFANARPALPDGKTQYLFNDPMVEGVAFEVVSDTSTWAKIRLRGTNLAFAVVQPPSPEQMVIGFTVAPPSSTIELTAVTLTRRQESSRVALRVSRLPQYEAEQAGDRYLVRLAGVTQRLGTRLSGSDERVELVSVEQDGEDLVLQIQLKRKELTASPLLLTAPPQLVFVFRDPAPAEQPEERPQARRAPAGEAVEALLQAEKNRTVRATYVLAEREFRAGKVGAARRDFLRVFNANTKSKLGIRAYFRAADSEYEQLQRRDARNYHSVIINYQTAIRAAESAGYETDLMPHAFFQIARAYQHMNFHSEADVHFRILQDRFPDNETYTNDSYFYQGQSFSSMGKFEDSVRIMRQFLERDGDPGLVAPAYYTIGDSLYSLGRFPEARRDFDRARRLNPEYPKEHPVLLFRMGETYYENAEFNLARTIYRELLERYPAKPYSKLVGLRLGDFLREEGKEGDALHIYRQVVENAPLEIKLRGKMRIANIFSRRPLGDDYKKALAAYDEVIAEGETRPVVGDALMRKALTLTLHNRNREAIATFTQLTKSYPASPFVRRKIVKTNLVENLKALVDKLFAAEEYWEVVKVFTKYRTPHFQDFRYNITLFQIARAYHFLGLYDEALRQYDSISGRKPGSLVPMIEFQMAKAHADRDNLGPAEEALLKYLRTYPDDRYITDARMLLGKVYFEGRRYQDALDAYRIVQRDFEKGSDPKLLEALPQVFYQQGNIHKELGQLKDAVDAYKAAVENFHHPLQGETVPEFIVLSQFFVGDVLFDLAQDAEAISAYEAAIARYPNHVKNPWARFQIGVIHRRNGRERDALEIFNALVELAKTQPGELWETLAKENQRDLVNSLGFQDYLKQ